MESTLTRWLLGLWTALVLAFLFIPIGIIIVYAFNPSNIQSWPISGLSTKWFAATWHNREVRSALWLSIKAALLATTLSVILGSAAAFAVHRFRFFGRDAVSFVVVLPIALNSFFGFWHFGLSYWTIVIGHTTFCIVIVYNNVIARLRRIPGSLAEASMDLGADGFTTFRRITLPMLSTALISGALLAFALSLDEVIVTTFTAGAQNTLPLWIFGAIRLGQRLPEVNVVVTVVMLATLIPVILAYRLMNRTPADSGK